MFDERHAHNVAFAACCLLAWPHCTNSVLCRHKCLCMMRPEPFCYRSRLAASGSQHVTSVTSCRVCAAIFALGSCSAAGSTHGFAVHRRVVLTNGCPMSGASFRDKFSRSMALASWLTASFAGMARQSLFFAGSPPKQCCFLLALVFRLQSTRLAQIFLPDTPLGLCASKRRLA